MIIDHIGFNVGEFEKSKAFYVQALAPLGIRIVSEGKGWAMVGKDGQAQGAAGQFWFGVFDEKAKPIHVAFRAENRDQVRAFYQAALKAGGKDNGPPGIRENYHPDYYAAFVFDPDGHNIEAVCHKAEE